MPKKERDYIMLNVIWSKFSGALKFNQRDLFALSALYVFASISVFVFSIAVPIIGISLVLVLSCGMKLLFIKAYDKKRLTNEMLFLGFQNLRHVLGGMLWVFFKVTVWLLVPFVGVFFAVAKAYEYRFVPYILITRPGIKAMDAPEISSKETNGFKLYMLYTDLILFGTAFTGASLLYWLSRIPEVGVVFGTLLIVFAFAALVFIPFFRGVLSAVFYIEIHNNRLHSSFDTVACPLCKAKINADSVYCSKCGEKLSEEKIIIYKAE